MSATDIRRPVTPKPGHWCLRRDGVAFRQDKAPDRDDLLLGSDNWWRSMNGRCATKGRDCVAIIGPICGDCGCHDGQCVREVTA